MVSFFLKNNIKKNIMILQKKDVNFLGFNFLGKRYVGEFVFITFLKNVIFGLNLKRFLSFLCFFSGCALSLKINFLTEKKLFFLQKLLFSSRINIHLKKFIKLNLQKKKKLNMYMGIRQKLLLPSRGQRSKTNAQTCKNRNNTSFFLETDEKKSSIKLVGDNLINKKKNNKTIKKNVKKKK